MLEIWSCYLKAFYWRILQLLPYKYNAGNTVIFNNGSMGTIVSKQRGYKNEKMYYIRFYHMKQEKVICMLFPERELKGLYKRTE